MRAYKWMVSAACLGLLATGCDGKDGADGATGPAGATGATGAQGETGATGAAGPAGAAGAQGDKGDKGDKGDTGAAGTPGQNGEDGLCAGVTQLAISDVAGNEAPVFPGEAIELAIDFDGGGDKVEVQFIGTALLADGTATIPTLPAEGAGPGLFDVTPELEGVYTYVAIATDGCTVATTTFTVEVKTAIVSIVHLYGGAGRVGFGLPDQELFITGTISPGAAYAGYFAIPWRTLNLDLYPDANADNAPDVDATPIALPTQTFEPGGRYIVVAHSDAAGELAVTTIEPDQAIIDSPTEFRIQLAHVAGGAGPVDVAADPEFTTLLFTDVAFGQVTEGSLLVPDDYMTYVDLDNDADPEFEVGLPFGTRGTFPGEYVVVFAWIDAADRLAIFVHNTGADGTADQHALFQFPGTISTYVGPPDFVRATETLALAVPDGDLDEEFNTILGEVSTTFAVAGSTCTTPFRIDFAFGITHTWSTDLDFFLTPPGGTEVAIGGPTLRTATSYEFTTETLFAGATVDGTWTLRVTDNASGDTGTIDTMDMSVWCD